MTNIFVEGIPGSGKSTLLKNLQKSFPDYHYYYEGDITPVELAWCAYMTKQQYQKALQDWTDYKDLIKENSKQDQEHYIVAYTRIHTEEKEFYHDMEQYEIYGGRKSSNDFVHIVNERFQNLTTTGNVFECAFFQNIIEELMLYAQYEDYQIIDFYKTLVHNIPQDFLIVRLVSKDPESSLLQIIKERVDEKGNPVWYKAMLDYLKHSPYGKEHNIKDQKDMFAHFHRRLALEDQILQEVLPDRYIRITSREYNIESIKKTVENVMKWHLL